MLDECITKKCAYTITEYLNLLRPPIKSYFLLDFIGKQGVWDVD